MAVTAANFFKYIEPFLDYRKSIYGTSEQTLKSNLIDLTVFEQFIRSKRYQQCIV